MIIRGLKMSNNFGLGMAGSNGINIDCRSKAEIEADEKAAMALWSESYNKGVFIENNPFLKEMDSSHEAERVALIEAYQEAQAGYVSSNVYSEDTESSLEEQYSEIEAKIALNKAEFEKAFESLKAQSAVELESQLLREAALGEDAVAQPKTGRFEVMFGIEVWVEDTIEAFAPIVSAEDKLKASRKAAKQAEKAAAIAARKGR